MLEVVVLGEHIVLFHTNLTVLADTRTLVLYDIGACDGLAGVLIVGVVLDDGLLPDHPALHLTDTTVGRGTVGKGVKPLLLRFGIVPTRVARHRIGVGGCGNLQVVVRGGEVIGVDLGNTVTVDTPAGNGVFHGRHAVVAVIVLAPCP